MDILKTLLAHTLAAIARMGSKRSANVSGYSNRRRRTSKLSVGYIIAGVILIGIAVFWVQYTDRLDLQVIEEWVEPYGSLAIVAFGAIYTALSIIGVSKVAMTVLAGTLFGFLEALIVTVVASTAAAVIGFFLARRFRQFISRRLLQTTRHDKTTMLQSAVDTIESNAAQRGFFTVALLRLSLVPLMFLSYSSGLVQSLRARDFIAAIFLTNIYVNFVYIFLGFSLTESLPMFAAAVALLLLFMYLPQVIERFKSHNNTL